MMALRDYIRYDKRFKARSVIFDRWSRWSYPDYTHYNFNLNLDSTKEFDKDYGDISKLQSFIEDCESGCLIDYDGWASEILLNGKVVWKQDISPSSVEFWKKKLQALNEQYNGQLEIVWYNK